MEYSILMKTLNNKYVPLWVKDYITSNKKKVNYVINSLTYSDIEYYCLKSTNLPIEFQNEILRLKAEAEYLKKLHAVVQARKNQQSKKK